MTDLQMVRAARVPRSVRPRRFGPWELWRHRVPPVLRRAGEFNQLTVLAHATLATMMNDHGETVMEDSYVELARRFGFLHGEGEA